MKRRWRIEITTEGGSDDAAAVIALGLLINSMERKVLDIKEVQVQRYLLPLEMEMVDDPEDLDAVLVTVSDPENGDTWKTKYMRDAVKQGGNPLVFDWGYVRPLEEKKRRSR